MDAPEKILARLENVMTRQQLRIAIGNYQKKIRELEQRIIVLSAPQRSLAPAPLRIDRSLRKRKMRLRP
jgi:hypothetical protein